MFNFEKNPPIIFFDFDNTISKKDILGAVIQKFSISGEWVRHEELWRQGHMGSAECMELQLKDIRVSKADLFKFINEIPIDSDFSGLLEWLKEKEIPVQILSDSFTPLIESVLEQHGIKDVPVYANHLEFKDENLIPSYPYRSPDCKRCAHCKKQRLKAYPDKTRIYVGDGLSDVCAAMEAEIVFAKDDLRAYLAERGSRFTSFSNLGDVLNSLRKLLPSAVNA